MTKEELREIRKRWAFIKHVIQGDIPDLFSEVGRLQAENDALRLELEKWKAGRGKERKECKGPHGYEGGDSNAHSELDK